MEVGPRVKPGGAIGAEGSSEICAAGEDPKTAPIDGANELDLVDPLMTGGTVELELLLTAATDDGEGLRGGEERPGATVGDGAS